MLRSELKTRNYNYYIFSKLFYQVQIFLIIIALSKCYFVNYVKKSLSISYLPQIVKSI